MHGMTYVGPDAMEEAALLALPVLWLSVALIAVLGRRGAASPSATTARNSKSWVGFAMQMLAYALVFGLGRPYFTPITPMSKPVEAGVLGAATAIGIASVAFCYVAMRALGKQWSLVARVVSGHQLIQQGPFAVVRNPIYLAMLGLLVQASVVVSVWWMIPPAVVVFSIGTWIRIQQEEKILRTEFGERFEEYSRRVPAFIPGFF
jgi:protein-S-isoprenylcysteine O-methyltransferase Ste14